MEASKPGPVALNWREVTAWLGGTFDPPHLGHLEAARGLLLDPAVRSVRLMPAGNPPLKNQGTPSHHRLEMTRLLVTLARDSRIDVDDREILASRNKPGSPPSTSLETLRQISFETDCAAFVIGMELLAQLPHWHCYPEFLNFTHWIVLERKGGDPEKAIEHLRALEGTGVLRKEGERVWTIQASQKKLILRPTSAPDLDSTRIRMALRSGVSVLKEQIPDKLLEYINENQLYGTPGKFQSPVIRERKPI